MSRPLNSTTQAAITEDITRPYYLVEMAFNTVIRFASGPAILWGGHTWLAASIDVVLRDSPVLEVFNETLLFGQIVLVEGTSGRCVTIYQGYANDALHPNPVMVFSGEMGPATIGETVAITCKSTPPLKTPRHYCVAPVFNHLPKAGTRFETPKGVVKLEGR